MLTYIHGQFNVPTTQPVKLHNTHTFLYNKCDCLIHINNTEQVQIQNSKQRTTL